MYTPEKTSSTAESFAEKANAKPKKCFYNYPYPTQEQQEETPVYGDVLQTVDGTVINPANAADLPATCPAAHPEPDRRQLITARALTGTAGVASILTGVLCGVAMTFTADDLLREHVYEDMRPAIVFMLDMIVLIECFFSLVAMAACFGLLFTRPYAVLIRSRKNHSLNCLRASIMLLFLFTIYSVAVNAYCASLYKRLAVYVVAAISSLIRCAAFLWFFVLLGINAKIQPMDASM